VTSTGRVIPPDPHKHVAGRRKSCQSSSKQRRKLQASSSESLLLHSAVPVANSELKSAPSETSRPQKSQSKATARSKMSRAKLKEKVAAAVHIALEKECLAMLSSLGEMPAKVQNEPPHVLSAQYMPLAQYGLSKHTSAPIFATAKRALERARGLT